MRARMKVRPESFGGIIFDPEMKLTVYVDKEFMRKLGYSEFPEIDHLSAPEVVHVEVTRRCPLSCKHCYSAGNCRELTFSQMKELIDILADMDVFQIAFGGGEPFAREDFIEIARYAHDCDIVPNVTTNGILVKNTSQLDIFRVTFFQILNKIKRATVQLHIFIFHFQQSVTEK